MNKELTTLHIKALMNYHPFMVIEGLIINTTDNIITLLMNRSFKSSLESYAPKTLTLYFKDPEGFNIVLGRANPIEIEDDGDQQIIVKLLIANREFVKGDFFESLKDNNLKELSKKTPDHLFI